MTKRNLSALRCEAGWADYTGSQPAIRSCGKPAVRLDGWTPLCEEHQNLPEERKLRQFKDAGGKPNGE